MTKTGKKFLERLASVTTGQWSYMKAWNIPVKTAQYEAVMRPCKERTERIINNYDRGLITEDEAAVELARLLVESEK